ncbi:DUF3516 domain-containing protein [Micrococcales bacterium 31B]|nr:DUF3516 domain-containing protein [Micrococcales bacterium 31B]
MAKNLSDYVPALAELSPETEVEAFLQWAEDRELNLYPHQEEALYEIVAEANVIVTTPTGSGKSMIATAAMFHGLATRRRVYYTAPIKALVSEKFFELGAQFGALNVGMMTGDSSVNAHAPIICCTAEIVANLALREGAEADAHIVIMDEFHYYGDFQRGWAWQVPLLELADAQFVLLSGTLGDVTRITEDLERRTHRETAFIGNVERPVPLDFTYAMTPIPETIHELLLERKAPIYVVHFTQKDATEAATAMATLKVLDADEKKRIAALIGDFTFSRGFGQTLSKLVRNGIGVHHAGMLPKYRRLVERLAQSGLLKIICGTDTLGIGINVPIRTVLFTGLTKFDGTKQRQLNVREYHQIAGRAGRAGFDSTGYVVVQAPEHVIENAAQEAKIQARREADGPNSKKVRKVVKKSAPEGFVNWSEATFTKLVEGTPESLQSRFKVTHSMLLSVVSRGGDTVAHLRRLLRDNHEPGKRQVAHVKRAVELFRGLLDAGIVTIERDAQGRGSVLLPEDLQLDFALNQPLSPFAIEFIDQFDPADPLYALDVVSVIEATLEDPFQVLLAQQSAARGEMVAELKADGVEYEERQRLIEEVTWPKPLADELQDAYEIYARAQPWVLGSELSPKSIVRDMFEKGMTFSEFIRRYSLMRSEGVVLRYLTDAYNALRRTVPLDSRTTELEDVLAWLGALVRGVDSSLLDEWEALQNPDAAGPGSEVRPGDFGAGATRGITANRRAFTIMVRNAMFARLEMLQFDKFDGLARLESGDGAWTADDWADAIDPFWDEYEEIVIGPEARAADLFSFEEASDAEGRDLWLVKQVLCDPQGHRDWALYAEVDLGASDADGELVLHVTGLRQHGL